MKIGILLAATTVWLAIVLAISFVTPASAGSCQSNSFTSTPFTKRVKANFKLWDKNQDKKISADELECAMHDHAISGGDAAALATLRLTERSCKTGAVLTAADLTAYEKAVNFGKRTAIDYDATYRRCRQRLDQVRNEFMWALIGHLESAHHGRFDQCSIFAVAHDLSCHDVKQLKRIVSKVGGSAYRISPPGRSSSVLIIPSLAEVAAHSASNRDCYLQKFVASTCNQLKPVAPKSPQSIESLLSSAGMLAMIPLLVADNSSARVAAGQKLKSRFSKEQGLELVAWLR